MEFNQEFYYQAHNGCICICVWVRVCPSCLVLGGFWRENEEIHGSDILGFAGNQQKSNIDLFLHGKDHFVCEASRVDLYFLLVIGADSIWCRS